MEPKKLRKKVRYRIMLVSNSSEGRIHQLYLGRRAIVMIAALCVLAICIVSYTSLVVTNTAGNTNELRDRVSQLAVENKQLVTQNTELSEKVSILSEAVNLKAQEDEVAAEKSLPTGFPLSGAATILEEHTVGEVPAEAPATLVEEAEPIVIFAAGVGTAVIATGSGTIQSIEEDARYGHILKLDHGNGYISVYRNQSDAKVKVGDEVTKATMLFEMGTDNEKLGYQIIRDNGYIDPLEMMEIYG